jgi:hypothetical protein
VLVNGENPLVESFDSILKNGNIHYLFNGIDSI